MTERLPNIPCCESMADQLNWSCDTHPAPSECPDALLGRFRDNRFGLPVHDGGASYGPRSSTLSSISISIAPSRSRTCV
jgi:hypothetical protein